MGIYSDNFYSWMDRQIAAEKATMDALGDFDEAKHSREGKGSEKGGQFKTKPETIEKQDLIDPVQRVETEATPKEFEAIKRGEDPETDNVRPVMLSELSTVTDGSTESKYRKQRNAAYRELMLKKDKEGADINGSYPLSDPTHKVQHIGEDGQLHDGFKDGFQVSFQTTNGEGYNPSRKLKLTDEEYDKIVDELIKETGSEPYLGVFGNIPEISFRCDTYEQAMDIAKRYNQVSIADNERIAHDIFDMYTFPQNPDYDWRDNQTFCMK